MANDGMLLVNFGKMQQAGLDIAKAVSTMQTLIQQAEASAAPLVDGWVGEAKEAYAQRQKIWRDASQDLTATLQRIQGAVEKSMDDYVSTEKQATARFQ